MREPLSRALYSAHLEWLPHECPIERVAAMRHGSRLGSALFRFKFGMDKGSAGRAYVLAVRKASKRLRIAPHHPDYPTLRRAVKQALIEFYAPQCRSCSGIGVIHADRHAAKGGVDHICPTCSGSGQHRYTDWERRRALNLDKLDKWSDKLSELLHMIGAAEIGLVARAREDLER